MLDVRTLNPVYWDLDENYVVKHKAAIRALKSLRNGVATEAEQLLALDYILNTLCNKFGNQFYPTERETNFAQGRKFVGDQIVGAINVPLNQQEK